MESRNEALPAAACGNHHRSASAGQGGAASSSSGSSSATSGAKGGSRREEQYRLLFNEVRAPWSEFELGFTSSARFRFSSAALFRHTIRWLKLFFHQQRRDRSSSCCGATAAATSTGACWPASSNAAPKVRTG